jgi:hypothetical protein
MIALTDHPKRAVEAFGKEGDNNGVGVRFAVPNEASAKDEAKGSDNSPDGILFMCTFDGARLKGDTLSRAMTHLGEHIADLRNPEAGLESVGMYQLEFRAWMTTMLGAALSGQKNLMLPGGYVVWNSTWPKDSLNKKTGGALDGFFSNEALLSK